jgi:hypothetical protein
VVVPVCEAGLAHRRGWHAEVVALLAPPPEQIRLLGGRNAQRDVFRQMLIDSAMKADRRDVVEAMIGEEAGSHCVAPGQRVGMRRRPAETDLLKAQCLKTKLVPADVARMVLWLASEDSRMCTSQLWVVDGGRI